MFQSYSKPKHTQTHILLELLGRGPRELTSNRQREWDSLVPGTTNVDKTKDNSTNYKIIN